VIAVGIDPGLSGGLVVLMSHDHGLRPVFKAPMPAGDGRVHVVDLASFLGDEGEHVFIEQAWARPGNASKSIVTSLVNYGRILGMLECRQIPHTIVAPGKWTRDLGLKATKDANGKRTKAANIALAKKLFPNETFLATPRCKKPHDGMVDAALIAYWGLMHGGKS
jgi:hypothetical protein